MKRSVQTQPPACLRVFCSALLVVLGSLLPPSLHAQAPGHTDWNAGRDLAANEKPDGGAQETANPNATVPQWSYGYRQAIASTDLTLYTAAEHHNSDGSGFEGFDGGPRNGSGTLEFAVSVYPATGYPNLGTDEIYTSIDTQSPDGNNVIRWTCPADGTYSYRIAWRDIDPNGGDGAAGYLVVNGVQKFKGGWPNGNGQGAATSGTLAMKVGDKFDVVLNANSSDSSYDSTGTRVVITPGGGTTPPIPADWDAGRDLAANENNTAVDRTANPNATVPQWSYGYRETIAGANLNLFLPDSHVDNFGNRSAEHGFVANGAGVSANVSTSPVIFSYCCGDLAPIFPGDMALDANDPAHVSVVRWTAPAAGRYTYKATWADVDPHGGNGAGGYVVVNGQQVFGQTWDNGTDNGASVTATVALQTGGTIDFVLDDKGDGNFDTTRFNATIVPGGSSGSDAATVTVPGTSNIWLAGAAPGTTASNGQDNLANATPFLVPNLKITPGTTMTFSATGTVSNDPTKPNTSGPDGGPYLSITFYSHDKENGIANIYAPINSLVGVFLDDSTPIPAFAPDGYDYSVPPGTIFTAQGPALGKPFFIGDGMTDDSLQQQVYVPDGATRLFLGSLDPSDSENNTGSFVVKINGDATQPPPTSGSSLVVTDTTYSSSSDGTGATAVPNDKITYGFTVRNTGDTTLANVVVTTVLNGIKFKNASDGGAPSPANKTQAVYPAFNLAPHTSKVLTFTAKVPGNFPLDGRIVGLGFASLKSDTATADLSGTAGLNSTVLPPYQTSVSYNAVVNPGDLLTFTFKTSNLSKEKIAGLTSVVHLPDGTTFKNVKNESGSALAVQPDGSGNLAIALPDLGPDQAVVYTVSVTLHADLAPDATVTLDPTRLVTSGGATTYNEPGAQVTLSGHAASSPPQLAISKRIIDQFTLAGLFIFYPQRAALLAAAFPDYHLYVTDPTTGQPVANPAEVARLGAALNPYTGYDETGSATGGEIRTVTAPNPKQPATYVTFALFYENNGGAKAGDITITDRIPPGFAFVPAAPASDTPGNLLPPPYALINGVPAVAGQTLTVTDKGRTMNFTVKDKLKPGKFGVIVYQLRVVPAGQGGPSPGTTVDTPGARIATSSLGSDVLAKPDGEPVLITAPVHFAYQTVLPTNNQGAVGTPVAFQFLYKNDGGKKASDFKVKVAVPKGTTFAGASVVSGGGSVSRGADGTVLFSIGKVKTGQSGAVEARFTPTADVFNQNLNPSQIVDVQFVPSSNGTFTDTSAVGRRPVARTTAGSQPTPRALPIDFNPPAPAIFHPVTDSTAPRLFIQRSAPLVAEQGKVFYYEVVVGNLGDRPADHATVTEVFPKGVDLFQLQGDPTQATTVSRGDRITNTYTFTDAIPAHSVRSLKLLLRVNPSLYSSTSGDVTATDDTLYVTSTAQPYLIYCPPVTTRLLRSNETVALVGAQAVSAGLAPYGFDASAVSTVAKAITTNSRVTTVGGADVLTTNQGAIIIPLGTTVGGAVGKGLGPVLVSGPAGVVSNDGASLISQDGSGLVAAGAGNLIQVSGLIGNDGTGLRGGTTQFAGSIVANLISQDGSGLVAAGAGNLIRGGGLNLISQDGSGLISNDGSGLIAAGAGNLVAAGAGNFVATRLISQDGTGLVAAGAGNLVAAGAGNVLANRGGYVIATGGGNITSGGAAGVLGSAPNTAALVAAGAGNFVAVGGGLSPLVAAGAGN